MKNLGRLLTFVLLTATLGWPQSQINSFQILRLGKQSTAPANPPINASYLYFDGTNVVCVTSSGASCLASSGGSGTVTSIATTSPIGGGTITGTGTLTCTTCVVASSPGSGVAHFAGSTQTVTSSAIVAADITSGTITGTQLSSSIALPNGATATTQAASDNSTKVATTAYVDRAAPAMVQLETHTASSSAQLDFTTCISGTTYHTFKFLLRNVLPAATNVMQMQVSTDGGGTWQAGSGYNYGGSNLTSGGAGGFGAEGQALWQISGSTVLQTASVGGASGEMTIYNPLGATTSTNLTGNLGYFNGASAENYSAVFAEWNSATAVNAVRFKFAAGNIASGVITCYGITP